MTKSYSVNTYGVLLSYTEALEYARKTSPRQGDPDKSEDDLVDFLNDALDVEHFCDTEGLCAFHIKENGDVNWADQFEIDDENECYVLSISWPSLFAPVYRSMDDLVAVLRDRYKGCLPESFDYRSHIGFVSATMYG